MGDDLLTSCIIFVFLLFSQYDTVYREHVMRIQVWAESHVR